jgi:hypothetical protein
VYWSAAAEGLDPAVVVTVTFTVPVPTGEVAVHELAVQVTAEAAAVPKLTLPPERFVPVTVTTVPPAAGPLDGVIPVTAGAGGVPAW